MVATHSLMLFGETTVYCAGSLNTIEHEKLYIYMTNIIEDLFNSANRILESCK